MSHINNNYWCLESLQWWRKFLYSDPLVDKKIIYLCLQPFTMICYQAPCPERFTVRSKDFKDLLSGDVMICPRIWWIWYKQGGWCHDRRDIGKGYKVSKKWQPVFTWVEYLFSKHFQYNRSSPKFWELGNRTSPFSTDCWAKLWMWLQGSGPGKGVILTHKGRARARPL